MPSMFRKKTSAELAAADDAAVTPEPESDAGLPDRSITVAPSAQNAIDLFDGHWVSSLPSILGLQAGTLPLFDDNRIKTLLANMDSIKNTKVLELAPLEGGHTYMLHEAGARVTAVESRSHAYLKCLVVKEILNLNRAHFFLGDFREYLATTKERYDLVLASGVLHEQPDPITLLEEIAKVTDRVAIWTHYWDDRLLADGSLGDVVDATPRETPCRGRLVKVHPIRSKGAASDDTKIFASWLERDALLTALTTLGFERVTVLDDEPGHPAGPAMLVLAER